MNHPCTPHRVLRTRWTRGWPAVLLLLLTCLALNSTAQAQLNGTYTVGGSGADYAAIEDAISALSSNGVSGAVTFLINDGRYTPSGSYRLPQISSMSSTNTVTFKPASGASVVIDGAVSSAIFDFNGGDYYILDGSNSVGGTSQDWKVVNDGGGRAVRFINGATYNTVKNMTLIGSGASASVGTVAFTTSNVAGVGNSFNTITGNTIGDADGNTRAVTAIYASGTSGTVNVANRIENNEIINFGNGTTAAYGIYTRTGNQEVKIFGNRIHVPVKAGANGAIEGIRFDNSADNDLDSIAYNRLWDLSNSEPTASIRGISAWNLGPASSLVLHDNMVSVIAGSGTIAGIYVNPTGASTIYLYNNSVYVGGSNESAATTSRALWVSTSATVTAENNILVNERYSTGSNTNRVIEIASAANTSVTDYNVLYAGAASTSIGRIASTNYKALAAWQAAGRDANSAAGSPRFVNPAAGDLHIATDKRTPVESRGTPIVGLTTDFDGDSRNGTTPDAGADEGNFLTPIAIDVEAIAITSPAEGKLVREATEFTPSGMVDNAGTTSKNHVTVRFRIIDQASGTTVYEDVETSSNLVPGNAPLHMDFATTGSVTGSTAALAPGTYQMMMWTELNTDGDNRNDTVSMPLVIKSPLAGAYTIDRNGSGDRNYTSFTTAVNELDQIGVSAPVTFEIADGTYDGTSETFPLTFTQATGVDANNTVAFAPASGAHPVLTGTTSFPIVDFDGADYVTFDGANGSRGDRAWKVVNNGKGQTIRFTNGATYNTIQNMSLVGGAASTGIVELGISDATAGGNSYNRIAGNTIGDPDGNVRALSGIYAYGTSDAGAINVANVIQGNEIINFGNGSTFAPGIYTGPGNQEVKIIANLIHIPVKNGVTGDVEGIRFDNDVDNYLDTIADNRIWDLSTTNATSTLRGITVWYLGTGSPLTIHTNMVSVVADDGDISGIYVDPSAAASVNVDNNSVFIGGSNRGSTTISRALWISSSAVVHAWNNVLVNQRTSPDVGTNNVIETSGTANLDYNLLWADGPSTGIALTGSGSYQTLADWQQGSGVDAHSVSGPVPFVDAFNGDLHIDQTNVFAGEGQGSTVVDGNGNGVDIDGDRRDPSYPDIGADEGNFNGGGIHVTSPNGGETFSVDYQLPVTFTTNRPLNVQVELSVDGGGTWTAMGSLTPTVKGENTITIVTPDVVTNNALVRVVSQINTNEEDASDAPFTLVHPLITIVAPNGGEKWVASDTNTISWSTEFMPPAMEMAAEYSTDGGATWTTVQTGILSSNLPATNSLNWTVPNTATTQGLLRLYIPGSMRGDTTDNVFTILEQPNVALTSPVTGDRWFVGEKNTIRWSSVTTDYITLDYSTDGGSTWSEIVHRVPAYLGSYDWTVPNTVSDNALVRITDVERPRFFAVSNRFSILQAKLTVLSPNGGEKYELNQQVTVTWTEENSSTVQIDYSLDNGTTWKTMMTGVSAALGTYTFMPPQVPTKNALIRVVDENRPTVNDVSDASFQILEPVAITIFSPATGDVYARNSVTAIAWKAPRLDAVNIYYSSNGGASWQTLATNVLAGQGSYTWNVPNANTTQGKIRISDVDGSMSAESGLFSIVDPTVPTLRVVAPNGGESYTGGDNIPILWAASGIPDGLTISYSTNSGASWTTIATNVSPTLGQYTWTAPNVPGTGYRVQIVSSSASDASDADFTVIKRLAPKVAVLTPNGGESLTVGTTEQITWTAEDVFGTFALQYSVDNGTTWQDITSVQANASGTGSYSYDWTVPNAPSTQTLVRVNASTASDVSDAVFEIKAKVLELIRVLTPNGNEQWRSRDIETITWTVPLDVVNVKIDFSIDNGATWTSVIASTPNSGSYNWKVPDVSIVTTQALVRVADASDATRSDVSDATFQISPATSGVKIVAGETSGLKLLGNFPNPFASATDIRWMQADGADVTLRIFDANGAMVNVVSIGRIEAGQQHYQLQAQELTSGVYHYELIVGGDVIRGAMMIVR